MPGRLAADRNHLAARVDDEVGRPRRVEHAAHHREPVDAHRQQHLAALERRQRAGHRQLAVLVVDDDRHAEGERREAFHLALRDAAQRRILDEHGDVPDLHVADIELVDARELQPSQADFADARAQRVGDRADARAARGFLRDHRLLRAGVEDEVLRPPAVHARLHDDLVVDEAERNRVRCAQVLLVDVDRRPPFEGLEELHLRPRPHRLVAAILVRQEVDEVGVGVRRFVEAVHPLVDLADLRVDLAVARIHRGGRLCFGERGVELRTRGKRARAAEARTR